MPTTNTTRMGAIAEELYQEGRYTQSFSVDAITAERDLLLSKLAMLEGARESANDWPAWAVLRHSDAITPNVPEGTRQRAAPMSASGASREWTPMPDTTDYCTVLRVEAANGSGPYDR